MTTPLDVQELSQKIQEQFPDSVVEAAGDYLLLKSEALLDVARFYHDSPGLELDLLVSITGVDYIDYFEVVYHLVSIKHNHSVVLKTRAYDRDDPTVPSLTSIWQGADLQEREVYDLMGITFSGHANHKRVLLWEGFPGHPLRKDFTGA
ncbi:MAG: NADH-quinone oxidoreductase subunit C [Dehalococcoidia bacterium]